MSGNDGSRWRRVSELPPQRPKQDGENSNTLNSRHSTGGFGAGLPQKKRVLATTTATAVTTMSKRRMSMKNRRVSFAPDPELTTIREFEKEERESPSLQEQQGVAQLPEGDPMMISPPQVPASGFGNPSNRRVSFGDITAGLPTLGELAEEEEHGDVPVGAFGTAGAADVARQYQDLDNVTHQVPGLGALLEEDEILEESIGKRELKRYTKFRGEIRTQQSVASAQRDEASGRPIVTALWVSAEERDWLNEEPVFSAVTESFVVN